MSGALSLCSQRGFIENLTRTVTQLNANGDDGGPLLNETELALRVGQAFKIGFSSKTDLDALAHLISLTTQSEDANNQCLLRLKTCIGLFQRVCEGENPSTETITILEECATAGDMFAMCGYADLLETIDQKISL